MSKTLYLLYEGPTGYALFKVLTTEEIGAGDVALQKDLQTFATFSPWVKLLSFAPYQSPENALEDAVCINESIVSPFLNNFLTSVLSKKATKSEANWELGVSDPKLGSAIHDELKFAVLCNENVVEMCRCLRLHAEKLLPEHQEKDILRAQCGLGHAFSRNKVKFNVHRSDNMIIQSSALTEHMDKGVNLLGMRVKEWYGWHFPELAKEVPEPLKYSKVALLIGSRSTLEERDTEEVTQQIAEILEGDEALAARVYEKAVTSMGGDMAEVDWSNIRRFMKRVVSLGDYRESLQQYLVDKMMLVAPNLTELMGQNIGAKLISKAGSLTNLAKSPASTIQILGAEKALFRALKKRKGNTPKYGLIFHSTFIQRAAKEHRGKISRYLANKAALACRIDCFMDAPPQVFGEKLREQVEARLNFFDTGNKPPSNRVAMEEALEQYKKIIRRRAKKQRTAQSAEAEGECEELSETPKQKRSRREVPQESA
ncbi:nucleolar protein, putative [Trypanosoma brucei gambiense DAL972]|uniref:Nucleolar protein 56 n=2 Tax=Trypanosoma brucei TaxID=5691 RepID=C9ZVG2_TRYB9|nr:nucleolar protein, putative [Trypanosoma brucei gambiense DAL972]CBH13400.1 nucleolar protein, putative [Trypanosoma brucei gambiense DAL972]|eukprot:XP_011775677.1 nucleolar protein, putative [Trypanosoma brucei gambiense DAL972]